MIGIKEKIISSLGLEDPSIFRERIVTNNLFKLGQYSIESEEDIYRGSGRTTSILLESILKAIEGKKRIIVYCRDFINSKNCCDQTLGMLAKVSSSYKEVTIKHHSKNNEIFFTDINSLIKFRPNLDRIFEEDFSISALRYKNIEESNIECIVYKDV